MVPRSQGAQKLDHAIPELHVQAASMQFGCLHADIWAVHVQHGTQRTTSSSRSSFSLSQKRLKRGSQPQAHPCLRC